MKTKDILFMTLLVLLCIFMWAVNEGVDGIGIDSIVVLELLIIFNTILIILTRNKL